MPFIVWFLQNNEISLMRWSNADSEYFESVVVIMIRKLHISTITCFIVL